MEEGRHQTPPVPIFHKRKGKYLSLTHSGLYMGESEYSIPCHSKYSVPLIGDGRGKGRHREALVKFKFQRYSLTKTLRPNYRTTEHCPLMPNMSPPLY